MVAGLARPVIVVAPSVRAVLSAGLIGFADSSVSLDDQSVASLARSVPICTSLVWSPFAATASVIFACTAAAAVVLVVVASVQTCFVWSAAVVVVAVLALALLLGLTLLSAQPAKPAKATVARAAVVMSFRMGVTSPRQAAPASPVLTRNGLTVVHPRHAGSTTNMGRTG